MSEPLTSELFDGKTVCFTGKLSTSREKASARAEQLGAKVVDGISGNVDILVVGADAGSKLAKARKLGITIVTADQWAAVAMAAEREYAAFVEKLRRPAFVPTVVKMKVEEEDPTCSRYYGRPWMPKGMEWPEYDDKLMDFVLQLRVADLPRPTRELLGGKGLLLFFYSPEINFDDEIPVSERLPSLVRLVNDRKPGGLRDVPDEVPNAPLPPLRISGWTELADHPGGANEEENLGIPKHLIDLWFDMDPPEDKKLLKDPRTLGWDIAIFYGDKLGGWPAWVQLPEIPNDANGKPMQMIYQVTHGGLYGKAGEDVDGPTWGTGHIFYSQDTGELYYGWACD